MLTENQVARSWRSLFSDSELAEDAFEKAEILLDELRPESPLRHRLGCELDEIRRLRQVSS